MREEQWDASPYLCLRTGSASSCCSCFFVVFLMAVLLGLVSPRDGGRIRLVRLGLGRIASTQHNAANCLDRAALGNTEV